MSSWQTFKIKGRKLDALELLGMLEDSDSETVWTVRPITEEIQ